MINGHQRINPTDVGDPLTFLLAPPAQPCLQKMLYTTNFQWQIHFEGNTMPVKLHFLLK